MNFRRPLCCCQRSRPAVQRDHRNEESIRDLPELPAKAELRLQFLLNNILHWRTL